MNRKLYIKYQQRGGTDDPYLIYAVKSKHPYREIEQIITSRKYTDYRQDNAPEITLDLNAKDNNGMTILMYCAKMRHLNYVQLLLDHGANDGEKDKDGRTALMYAVSAYTGSRESILSYDIVKILAETTNKNIQNKDGNTALMEAIIHYKPLAIIELLLKSGVNPNLKNNNNVAALLYAIRYFRSIEIIKLLLINGADPNLKDDDNNTALLDAIQYHRPVEIIELLLTYGADPNLKNNSNSTAFSIAKSYHDPNVLKLLEKYSKKTQEEPSRITQQKPIIAKDNEQIISLLNNIDVVMKRKQNINNLLKELQKK